MLFKPFNSLHEWVDYLSGADIPVLRRTIFELKQLETQQDTLSGRDLTSVIIHDPMMTLKILRYLQSKLQKSRFADITTIGKAIIMLGITPFFQEFSNLIAVEDTLATMPEALKGLRKVTSRSFHAAVYAQDWAAQRQDLEAEEVTIAALLHDMTEILLWCFAAPVALSIRNLLVDDPHLRSHLAQQHILGFPLLDLQLELVREWQLPELLKTLMDDHHAGHPRTLNVTLAVGLARHSANSWYDAALPHDYFRIHQLLRIPEDEVIASIHAAALRAARNWKWYGVLPTATWLPLLPNRRES